MRKVELVSPAGNLEKLKFAILYGADAVYLSGEEYGLRSRADNFGLAELEQGIAFAHQRNKKVYLAINIFARDRHLDGLTDYLKKISGLGVDAVIVSEPGVFSIVRKTLPTMDIHISTQANVTNRRAVEFWRELGAKRIILSRELTLKEIEKIALRSEIETEVFVHGAMCISYSGRCLLSSYMVGRSANLGDCAQSCRWKYALTEEKRPGEYHPIDENGDHTYIISSRDLCMIKHIPSLIGAGIDAMKIEGRMKSIYYVALTTRVYREALDSYYLDPEHFSPRKCWVDELAETSDRGFTTGFFFGNPREEGQAYGKIDLSDKHRFLAIGLENKKSADLVRIQAKNKIVVGDEVEIMSFLRSKDRKDNIREIYDADMNKVEKAYPGQIVYVKSEGEVHENEILRRL